MLPFFEVLDTKEKKEQLAILYKCFRDELYQLAYFKLKSTELAEDFVHETFMTLTTNLNRIDDSAYNFLRNYLKEKEKIGDLTIKRYSKIIKDTSYSRAWYYVVTILNNKIYDMYRKQKSNKETCVEEYFDEAVASISADPLEVVQKKELQSFLEETIRNLKSPYKEAIYLKYFSKLSVKEICEILDKSNDNVRQILTRGRAFIKAKLQEGGYDEIH